TIMKLADIDIPQLEDGQWINLTEAAELLGYTRSYMYKRASKYGEPGGFQTLFRVGNQASYVISREEVNELLAEREVPAVEEVVEPVAPKKKAPAKKKVKEKEPEPAPVADIQPEESP